MKRTTQQNRKKIKKMHLFFIKFIYFICCWLISNCLLLCLEIMHTTTWPTFSNNQVYRLDTNSTEVTISSPGFPLQYPTSTQINYTISVPFGFHVSISFLHFAIEDSERYVHVLMLIIIIPFKLFKGVKLLCTWLSIIFTILYYSVIPV